MGAAILVSVEEYLSTSYSPDREYVDGRIVERNLGEKTHSSIQRNLIGWFWDRRNQLPVKAFPEQRVQVSPTRFRIPDVTVVKTSQVQGEIFTAPPHLCIEILSKDDTMVYMQEKIDDYLRFGVPYIWIINPRLRKGYVATKAGIVEAESGVLATSDPEIRVPVAELLETD
ncbi:MAG: Uma2 family endonuclease [Bryobacteraceae bacterium]|jgi:Uma2 family endonuclease